jgi:hypothetical protein
MSAAGRELKADRFAVSEDVVQTWRRRADQLITFLTVLLSFTSVTSI